MKKIIFLILLTLTGFLNTLQAAPGDTTRVPVHLYDSLTYYGSFNRKALLPTDTTKTYRRIYFLFTLGKYQCAPGTQYCGSWDYSLDFVARPIMLNGGNDLYEIARGITPYATAGTYFPWTWEHTYYLDVTDFAPILRDSLEIQAKYSGYSGGFTLKTELMFIEGTPERKALSVHKVQRGYYNFGGATSIEANLIPDTTQIELPATQADMLIAITGHGSDDNGCSEFCKKYYTLKLNGDTIAQRDIWRMCGFCDIQAQTGTWPYDRANWCPGEKVPAHRYHLNGITPGTPFVVDMDMENYTSPNGGAGYSIASYVVGYGPSAFTLDAMIEDIISPSTKNDYKKFNSTCSQPTVLIKNGGTNPINTLTIRYGMHPYPAMTYTWNGNLQFLQEAIVTLPAIPWGNMLTDSSRFFAYVENPNGQTDQYALNDTAFSLYRKVPTLPANLVIRLSTNNTAVTSGGPYNETSWRLFDQQGNLVKERVNNANSTVYLDTLTLTPGCYKFAMADSGWMDGFNFWYYAYYPTSPGNGSLTFRNAANGAPLGPTATRINEKYYNGDFGSGFEYHFKVDFPTFLDPNAESLPVEVYPNPANAYVYVDVPAASSVQLINMQGTVLQEQRVTAANSLRFETANYAPGLYSLRIMSGKQVETRKLTIIH